jgi:hypothetical protein
MTYALDKTVCYFSDLSQKLAENIPADEVDAQKYFIEYLNSRMLILRISVIFPAEWNTITTAISAVRNRKSY